MTVNVSTNLRQRIKLLKDDIKLYTTLKNNNNLKLVSKTQLKECYHQLQVCKRLLKSELMSAPVASLLTIVNSIDNNC